MQTKAAIKFQVEMQQLVNIIINNKNTLQIYSVFFFIL